MKLLIRADKMNIVLLVAVIFTFDLVLGNNNQPCLKSNKNNAYNDFVKKHIVQKDFDRESKDEWKIYIGVKGLCDRPLQSFFESSDEDDVDAICNGQGHPLSNYGPGNLCMSDSNLSVYDLKLDNNCNVLTLKHSQKKVIVACDVIANQCVPVHYQKNEGQIADSTASACQPA